MRAHIAVRVALEGIHNALARGWTFVVAAVLAGALTALSASGEMHARDVATSQLARYRSEGGNVLVVSAPELDVGSCEGLARSAGITGAGSVWSGDVYSIGSAGDLRVASFYASSGFVRLLGAQFGSPEYERNGWGLIGSGLQATSSIRSGATLDIGSNSVVVHGVLDSRWLQEQANGLFFPATATGGMRPAECWIETVGDYSSGLPQDLTSMLSSGEGSTVRRLPVSMSSDEIRDAYRHSGSSAKWWLTFGLGGFLSLLGAMSQAKESVLASSVGFSLNWCTWMSVCSSFATAIISAWIAWLLAVALRVAGSGELLMADVNACVLFALGLGLGNLAMSPVPSAMAFHLRWRALQLD